MLAEGPQMLKTSSHRLLWVDTDTRHIISVKLQGFYHAPQDIMEEYNGCLVPKYTAYPLNWGVKPWHKK